MTLRVSTKGFKRELIILMGVSGLISACQDTATSKVGNNTLAIEETEVSDRVKESNAYIRNYLDLDDTTDQENAERGFIASFEETVVKTEAGGLVYDFGAYEFLKETAPNTANPSLWRQSALNAKHGLFKVMDGIYQVRGYDVSNITFIRGETGWIVVDPLITKEVAARAKELVDRELGVLPVTGVVFTHSHLDHYGGVRGLISESDIENGTEIIAPDGFVRETVSENILAGNAMGRRASYMFGNLLPKSAEGQIGVGLAQTISSGTPGLLYPTINVDHTGQSVSVDGVEMEFILTLDAEAPSEFMFYLPQFKAFCQAEIINHTFHNMYTPRGAKVRDGRRWSKYIDEAIYIYGDKTNVSFGSHNWPVWGKENALDLWSGQRDLYRYVHDQTLRLANQGHTMHEIPELLDMPDGIAKSFSNRGYYGTISHNSKAQYQGYMAESGSWRNFYLTGASELRNGIRDLPTIRTTSPDMVRAIPLDLYFDMLAVRMNGPAAAQSDFNINFQLTDTKQSALLLVSNGTLHHRLGQSDNDAPTIKLTRPALDQLNQKQKTFAELVKEGAASIEGDATVARRFFSLIEEPEFWFEIVRP